MLGLGAQGDQLGWGFVRVWTSEQLAAIAALAVLLFLVSIFSIVILLDKRENSYCVPLERSASILATNLRQNLEWTEKETVRKALDTSKGVKKDAAELMGISQRAMSYYLAKHHID